ncbi:unnamed protein product [Prorocentrum cordatum]|uniref:Hexosyltransferase n=1 Tax=Prorocentrum cordatum TaxID=2364126 RepID=A0ABN9YDK8_9DINO|nr:unnamed protein product [Polarella glacialis]
MPRGPLDPLDPPEGACPPRAFCGAAELEAPLSGTCEWAGCSGSRRVRWWRRAWKLHAAAGAVAALLSAALALAIWRSAGLQSAQSRAPEAPTMASKAAEDLPGLQATGPKAIDAPGLSLAGRAAGLERVVAATTATSTTTRAVSLFCFSVMVSGEWERELVTFQLQASAGIFACDRTVVFSDGPSLALGRDAEGNDAATWPLRPTSEAPDSRGLAPSSRTASRLSATALARAFDELIGDELGAMWAYDWLVKADLDTVFFPDRLRLHLADHGRGARYLLGCTPRLPARARLHGALAAFSAPAMEAYRRGAARCGLELGQPGREEGAVPRPAREGDAVMQQCLELLGVEGLSHLAVLADEECVPAPCSDNWRAAFHPYRDVSSWVGCWHWSNQAGQQHGSRL